MDKEKKVKEKKVKEKSAKLMPVFDTFEAAFKIWWKNLKKFIMIYVWGLVYALVPMVITAVLFGVNYWFGDSLSAGIRMTSFFIGVLSMFVCMYFFIRSYIGIFLLVKNDYKGDERKIFAETRKLVWPYIGLVLMTAVFIVLWTLLLIIPGIIYAVLYSFACYALFFEGKNGMAAIRRSRELVTGYFWPVFGRFMFVGLIIWVFSMLISIPLSIMGPDSIGSGIWSGIVQVLNTLIGPIVLVYTYSIYAQLVKLKK